MAIGRPRQFDSEKALGQARERFWQQGFAATSLHDLLECMHLSKSSLYQSFGNKQQLFILCLEQYEGQVNQNLTEQLHQAGTGLGFIRELLKSVISEADRDSRKGCLLVNTANELAGREKTIAQAVSHGLIKIKSNLKSALERARDEGDIAPDTDLEQASDYLVAGISGLRTMVKAGADRESLSKVAEMMMQTLK
jgi:TetR/AcrR family transcriptional repressor of nem operon